ncbi:family 78 glycoside hydrolase catalytic domain [Prevotella sp. MA2016]|uniref:family 78 glycoside hydrolase catalytic domain n=1 Tax=Prevotella sp. MA2016 TaxID=1408310 RepID=UPI001E55754F|nr:family 78 glycoside hydrolase catalytic domain [Prevotella sp. MA2016]
MKRLLLLFIGLMAFWHAYAGKQVMNRVVVAYVTAGTNDVPDPTLMTHINYAFGTVNKTFNGVDIQNPTRLRMIAGLKQQNPELKVLLSIGGWTAGRFSEMAATKQTRGAFAKDCKRIVDEFGLDGIDIDWEYPSSSEAGISSSPDDIDNFTLLMKNLRRELGKNKLLTIATICTAKYIDFKKCLPYLDLVNVMSYDMSDPNHYHHAALYPSPISGYCTGSEAVEAHLKAGVPKEKLVMGMPFYQKGRRQDPGVDSYLKTGILPVGYSHQWHDVAKADYIANEKGEFVWAIETTRSLGAICQYILDNNLRGGMYWEYANDRTGAFSTQLSEMLLQRQTTIGQKTKALDATLWNKSVWISAANAPIAKGRADQIKRAADGASWFVSTIKNNKPVTSAKWMTAGLGVYELYLNGHPVGQEILKPGFTHYAKTKRSFTYDITAAFKSEAGSENTLAVQVTPGWWADKIITPGEHDGMIGKKCAFRGVLELTFADGTKQYYGTNQQDWKAGIAGPVKHASIFDGEEYDARELPGYATLEKLSTPEINTEFNGDILPSEGAEIYLRRDLAIKPVNAYIWQGVTGEQNAQEQKQTEYGKVIIKRNYKQGDIMTLNPGETLVIDFGQNTSGVPAFSFKAQEGTVLTCLPGEILNDGNGAESRGMDGPEGSVHRRNLRIQDTGVRINYTFGNNDSFVSYYPHCTFFGYRYISVTATDQVEIQEVKSLPVTSIAQRLEIGTITTGNELVNKIISNTLWGQRSNYLSVPTDCPQRDERLGWMADTQVFAEAGTYFANTNGFFHKWTRDVRDSQSETGGYPGVSPIAQYGNETMRLGWADAGVIVPWTVWKQFGDKTIIDENWQAMERFMNHINETKYDHQALIKENGNYQWADWLSYEPLESCTNLAFDEHWKPLPDAVNYWNYLSACYWQIDAEMMRDMALATGRDATRYQQMAEAAQTYLKAQFLDKDGNFKTAILNTMQTPALFALKNHLVEGPAKERTIQRLRENFATHDNCLQTGFLGTSILMATLTENGMADIAYELLYQRKNPSWIYSIDNGATTIWERWNSYRRDTGLGPNGMNSFNHYAYGAVCEWIWETAAGISADTKTPGFKHIIMKPVPDKRLGFVKAEYQSAAGMIKSEWRYEGDEWQWDFSIPAGASATVTLPGETTAKEYSSGTYHIQKKL